MFAYSSMRGDGFHGIPQPKIKIPESSGNMGGMTDENHSELLDYLVKRLHYGNAHFRDARLFRYARIDKLISTWQKLSPEDSKREKEEDITGRNQAIPMNLPLLASHLEDSVSFFSEVFAPQRRDFYVVSNQDDSASSKELAEKMNRDTKARKYYSAVCATLRTLLKYNVGGFAVRFESGGGVGELSQPGNRIESLDMYNYLYDPSVIDVDKISTEAEWTARISQKNRMWVEKRGIRGELQRVDKLLGDADKDAANRNSNKQATFYKRPPSYTGLGVDGQDDHTASGKKDSGIDWDKYGASLSSDATQDIQGYEVIEMYCWLNASQFGLESETQSQDESAGIESEGQLEDYSLWRFIIIDSCQVCFAERVTSADDGDVEIPHYLAHLTQDDMREAQRSVMEFLRPFQRFASFLMNIYVAGGRKNIWGIKGVDPQMFDTSGIESGDVAGVLKSKQPGRDVRTGLLTLDSNTGVQESFQMLTQTLEVVRTLFPSQAMPAQIAGIERAVKSQVAAVMQGVHRRLHMSCRLLDSSLFSPTRTQCYRNLARWDSNGLQGLNEEKVSKILGSGLQQLNSEAIAQELRELLFAVMQNPESQQNFDLASLMTMWSRMMNMPTDLGEFVRQQPQGQPGQPGESGPGGEAAAGPGGAGPGAAGPGGGGPVPGAM